jgi:hypothetical protein
MAWPIHFKPVETPWGETVMCRNSVRFAGGLAFIKASNSLIEFLIDERDLARVAPYHWSSNNGYAKTNINRVTTSMQWLLCDGWSKGVPVDHINRVRNDNRRLNLRLSSVQGNAHNLPIYKRNTSGYPGVHWHSASKKWHVDIAQTNGGVRRHSSGGYFKCFHEACRKSKEIRDANGYFTHPLPSTEFQPYHT